MINLKIILHAKTLLEDSLDSLLFIGDNGEYGILENHAPVILFSRTGYLRVKERFIYFTDGILKFYNNEAILLASVATIGASKEEAYKEYEKLAASIKKESEIELIDFSKLERELIENIKKGSPSKL